MNVDMLKGRVERIVEKCDRDARLAAMQSQTRYRIDAGAGDVIPNFGEFQAADDDARELVRYALTSSYEAICGEIDYFMAAESKALSKSANADDVATVQLTLSRKNVTEHELQALYDRFSDNRQLAAAICDKAKQQGYELFGEAAPEYFPDDAKEAAGRIFSRYDGSSMCSAHSFADNVAMNLEHVDIFGNRY